MVGGVSMHVVKFCEVGRVLGTRAAGKKIREKIGDNIIETKKGIGYIINEK